jgi:hypothetical protein
MRSSLVVSITAAAGLAATSTAQTIANAVAVQTGTIQPTGPRQPANGDNFFNIEGANNTTFASYGVARWDLTAVRAAFDATYGAGQWRVTSVELEMTQDNAAFSHAGAVSVYLSSDDSTDVKTAAAPVQYPFFDPLTSAPDLALANGGSPILQYSFPLLATGTLDRYTQSGSLQNGAALSPSEVLSLASDLTSHIQSGNTLTFVFVEGDPATAATYRGQAASTTTPQRVGPNLFITAIGNGSACYPNCDNSTTPPVLNVNDFICFQSAFAAGNSYANCDHSTTPPVLNVNDFICFQSAFAAGCSAP